MAMITIFLKQHNINTDEGVQLRVQNTATRQPPPNVLFLQAVK